MTPNHPEPIYDVGVSRRPRAGRVWRSDRWSTLGGLVLRANETPWRSPARLSPSRNLLEQRLSYPAYSCWKLGLRTSYWAIMVLARPGRHEG